jgi:hypothetical protein
MLRVRGFLRALSHFCISRMYYDHERVDICIVEIVIGIFLD